MPTLVKISWVNNDFRQVIIRNLLAKVLAKVTPQKQITYCNYDVLLVEVVGISYFVQDVLPFPA